MFGLGTRFDTKAIHGVCVKIFCHLGPFGHHSIAENETIGKAIGGLQDRGSGGMMTQEPQTDSVSESDSQLWQLVCRGSASAFEVVVRRYQSLVCSVAYNACGNLALSEDIAQETFWAAWRQRSALEQPDRLKAWLCG